MKKTNQMNSLEKFYCEVAVGQFIIDESDRSYLEVYDYLLSEYMLGKSSIPSDLSCIECNESLSLYETLSAINEWLDLMVDSTSKLFQKIEKVMVKDAIKGVFDAFDFNSFSLRHYSEVGLEKN